MEHLRKTNKPKNLENSARVTVEQINPIIDKINEHIDKIAELSSTGTITIPVDNDYTPGGAGTITALNTVVTGADGSHSIMLPKIIENTTIFITNLGNKNHALLIYPQPGEKINGQDLVQIDSYDQAIEANDTTTSTVMILKQDSLNWYIIPLRGTISTGGG